MYKTPNMQKIRFYNNDYLDKQRLQTDPLADRAVSYMFESGQAKMFRELTRLLETNDYDIPSDWPNELQDFLVQSRQLPAWADGKKIREGQAFFKKHASSLTLMLGLMSLPYDYAAANGAQVLLMSDRLRYDAGKRLVETGKYVFDVGTVHGFEKGGKAIASAQKVRLIHAAIRYHIKKSGKWQQQWGEPVNQEDMAGTNLSMSLIPVRGMRKLGIEVNRESCMAYVHLWNVASYMMGVNEKLLPDTSKEAFVLDKAISGRQFRKSEAGTTLTASLLSYIKENANSQLQWLAPKLMRYLLGDTVADTLEIPKGNIPPELLVNPLQNWNRLLGLLQPNAETFYDTRFRYHNNAQKVTSGKKVGLNVPEKLKQ